VGEGVGGDHLDGQAVGIGRFLEPGDDPVALGVVGVEGEDVVVVEGDAPGAELGELLGVLPGAQGGAGRLAEGIGGEPADRPQAERELVLLGGLANHGLLLEIQRAGRTCAPLFVRLRNYIVAME